MPAFYCFIARLKDDTSQTTQDEMGAAHEACGFPTAAGSSWSESEQREEFSLDYSYPQDTRRISFAISQQRGFCGLGETRVKVLQEACRLQGEGLKLLHVGAVCQTQA